MFDKMLMMWAVTQSYLSAPPKHDEDGIGAVEWAVITALGVLIAYAVYRIITATATDTASGIATV